MSALNIPSLCHKVYVDWHQCEKNWAIFERLGKILMIFGKKLEIIYYLAHFEHTLANLLYHLANFQLLYIANWSNWLAYKEFNSRIKIFSSFTF